MTSPLQIQKTKEAKEVFWQRTKPFREQIVRLHQTLPTTYILNSDNQLTATLEYWPEWASQSLQECEQMMDTIYQQVLKEFEL